MKKLLTICLGLGLFSQQAFAVTTETVTGENFAGYANSVLATTGGFMTDLGNSTSPGPWSSSLSDIYGRVTDTSAGSNILGTQNNSAITLGFSTPVVDGSGNDLKLFFVGNNGHKFDVTIGGASMSYTLGAGTNTTGFFDPAFSTDPIIALAINLSDFTGLAGSSFDRISVAIGDGYCDGPIGMRPTTCPDITGPRSAVLSFVGTYNVAVVPVPAAVWLFGSGLLGLVGFMRKRA